jgi:hypothetical protein
MFFSRKEKSGLVSAARCREITGDAGGSLPVCGTDPDLHANTNEKGRLNDLPANYSPRFAPAIDPPLDAGGEILGRCRAGLASGIGP